MSKSIEWYAIPNYHLFFICYQRKKKAKIKAFIIHINIFIYKKKVQDVSVCIVCTSPYGALHVNSYNNIFLEVFGIWNHPGWRVRRRTCFASWVGLGSH